MEVKNKILLVISMIIFQCCKELRVHSNNDYPVEIDTRDSLIYNIGIESEVLVDSILNKYNTSTQYVKLISNVDNDKFKLLFYFSMDSCSLLEAKEINKVNNTYVKIKNKYIPLFSHENLLFLKNRKNECPHFMNSMLKPFNGLFIEINSSLEILSYKVTSNL